ncbi:hypothetical protein GCM10022403_052940 [Streptomyces coacervatus]|uniref:DUF3298 domain-containing protein n=1 Tax=Streptomyces coacervatus TaxID=647381 RepID=A0ABP7I988_9ACTN|nr:hypothetical protein [Streptomyces coacervatus]MDF2272772.1 hypothetical protein [Streptomyces coacervatus]
MTGIEDELRAALHADADRIRQDGLRPPATFPATRSPGSRRRLTTLVTVAAAAATALVVLGVHLLMSPPARDATPLTVTFTSRTSNVAPTKATITLPVPEVHGTNMKTDQRVSKAIRQQLTEEADVFRNRITSVPGTETRGLSAKVTVGETVTWGHYLSVRFDTSADTGDEHPVNESDVLTFDTRTGAAITLGDMFTDLDKVGDTVRAAMLASRPAGTFHDWHDLETVTLNPSEAGITKPPSCYPTPAGLRCRIDQGQLTPFDYGWIDATVPWKHLTHVLRPGVHG